MLTKTINFYSLEEEKPKVNKRLLFLIKYSSIQSIYKIGTVITDELFVSQNEEYYNSADIICWAYLPFDSELDVYFFHENMKSL